MARGKKKAGFEDQLKELESIVSRIESGDLPLEESLDLFEKGIHLSRELQAALRSASLRVTRLIEGDPPKEVPFQEPPTEGQALPGSEKENEEP